MRVRKGVRVLAVTAISAAALAAAACGGGDDSGGSASGDVCDGTIDGPVDITVQWHQGAEAEVKAVQKMVKDFNAGQQDVKATLKLVPEADYASSLSGQADSDSVPDVVDTDASKAFAYAWSGDLQPISSCIPDELSADLLPSITRQGEYAGEQWAVGMVDSGLGIYTTKTALKKSGVRQATLEQPWTAEEFTDALGKFKAAGYSAPADLKKNYGQSEWYAYGFAPIVLSGGGALLNEDNSSADGQLNSDGAVEALTTFQGWFKEGLVGDNTDDNDFLKGKSAISWVGHWMYNSYKEEFGDDLVVLPLPDFGTGVKTGQGSWQWGIGANAADADAAWSFIEYTMQPAQQKLIAEASGGIPARTSVAATDPKFAEGGDLRIFVDQHAAGLSVPRPTTPAYVIVSDTFNQAIQDIIDGADVRGALDEAVSAIDQDIEDNSGYPDPGT